MTGTSPLRASWAVARLPISLQDVPGLRRIYRLTERTIDKRGQPLLLPEYVLEGGAHRLRGAQLLGEEAHAQFFQ